MICSSQYNNHSILHVLRLFLFYSASIVLSFVIKSFVNNSGGNVQTKIPGCKLTELGFVDLVFIDEGTSLCLSFLELKKCGVDLVDPSIRFIFAGSEAS